MQKFQIWIDADIKPLFITTARKFPSRIQMRHEPLAGSVLSIEVDVPGLLEQRFGAPMPSSGGSGGRPASEQGAVRPVLKQ